MYPLGRVEPEAILTTTRAGTVAGLLVLAGWCGPLEAQPAGESVGFVVEVRGDWLVEGGAPGKVRVGQTLRPGAAIRAVSPQPSWRLVVALANGKSVAKVCDPSANCLESLVLPGSLAEQPGFWGRAKAAAAALLGHSPERFAATVSRGTSASDGVALLESGTLHLESILGDLAPGRYAVSVRRWESEAAGAARRADLTVPGPPSGPQVEVAGLGSGLFELTVWPVVNPEEAASAWVLALDGARYAQGRSAFETAEAATAAWPEARPQAVRAFLRAHLMATAEELAH